MSARRRNIVENILQSQVDFDQQKKRKAEEEEKNSRDSYPSTPTSGNHFTIHFCL